MKKIQLKQIDLFLAISILNTIFFLLLNILQWGKPLSASTLGSGKQFCDFFYHTAFSSPRGNIYRESIDVCFPPLAYCMYYLLWRTAPYQDSESVMNWRNYMGADNALLIFVMYNMVLMILIGWSVFQYFHVAETKYVLFLPLTIIFSYPLFCTSIQRGNAVLLVAIFLSFAWLWMDSDNPIKRELALVLIAVSAGFKIYPAILGVEYIRKKDWKKVLRLIVYGIIMFFLPFIFFGGYDGLKELLSILSSHAAWSSEGHYGSVRGMLETLAIKLDFLNQEKISSWGFVAENVFLIVSFICFSLSKEKWQRVLFISGILASYLGYNWGYTAAYYLPALLVFLQENGERILRGDLKGTILISINTVAFAVIFSVPWFFQYILQGGIYEGIFIITYIMLAINAVCVIKRFIQNKGIVLYEA